MSKLQYCPCGHSLEDHYLCDCPNCNGEHCSEGCECEELDKNYEI